MLGPRGRSILPLSRRFSPVPRRLPQRAGAGAAALAAWPHLCLLVVCVAPEERERTREPCAEAGSWLEGTPRFGSTPRRDREARARVLVEGRRVLKPLAHTTPFHWWPRRLFPGASIGFSLKTPPVFQQPSRKTLIASLCFSYGTKLCFYVNGSYLSDCSLYLYTEQNIF